MKKFRRVGVIKHGGYSGGEWYEDETPIIASGSTKKKLQKEVDRLTEMHSSNGSPIDFGFIDNIKKVTWEDEVLKEVL